MRHRSLPAFLALAGAHSAGIVPAAAHAFLDTADPAVGATIQSAPSTVSISFTEALEPLFSSITVEDAASSRVDKNDVHADPGNPKRLTVDLKPLAPGSYKVVWRATSVDTHKTSGTYMFMVAK